MDCVAVASPGPPAGQIAGCVEAVDQPLDCSLVDADGSSDVRPRSSGMARHERQGLAEVAARRRLELCVEFEQTLRGCDPLKEVAARPRPGPGGGTIAPRKPEVA